MKLLIAGSRSITDLDPERLIPKETEFIICGGAGGIDRLAERAGKTLTVITLK